MHDRLSIAHVNSERGFLGGEAQIFLLLEGLRERGHRVVLLCPPGSRSSQEARRLGIEVVPVRMRNELDAPAVFRIAAGLRSSGADLVHLHSGRANWLGGIAARVVGLPAVSTRRMDRRVKKGWRTRLLYRRLVRSVASISPAVTRCLTDGGVPAEMIRLVPDAVDPGKLRPSAGRAATRAALGAGETERVVLTVAALIPRKGIDVLIDALGLLAAQGERPVLWVAGDGPEREALAARAAGLGVETEVRFLGERRDVPDLLAGADVFVLPSRREGMGVAALEAMAAGRPVVASSVGGLSFAVVEGRTGLLVPPEDPGALAAALGRVLGDASLRERLGREGPARIAERFLAGTMVDAYERIYEEVLAEPGSGAGRSRPAGPSETHIPSTRPTTSAK